MTELVQTKNAFKLVGKVCGIDKDGAYKEDVASKGKRQGDLFRSLRFQVETSPTNRVTVSMYDFEPNEIFLWNSDKRKKDSSYKGDRIPFAEWEERQDQLRDEGYAVLQTRIGVDYKEDGKLDSKGLPSFVASQVIYDNVDNGDYVVVEGEIRHSVWKKDDGTEVPQSTYTIKKLHKIKDLDFESEKFEEITYFEEEVVFIDSDIDKKEGKMYLTGRTIDYGKNFQDIQMVVNFKNEDGEIDSDMVKLVDAIKKRVKFGDIVKVFGDIQNRVVVTEVENDDDGDVDIFAEFGGRKKPKHAETYTAKTYISEMSIHGIEAHDKGVYKEEDFVKDELVDSKEDDLGFGGKGKKSNPFAGEAEDDEISEDDLPF